MKPDMVLLNELHAASRGSPLALRDLYRARSADVAALKEHGLWFVLSATQGNITEAGAAALARPLIIRDEAIERIRAALKVKTGKSWSVRGGSGTSWGWIDVLPLPREQPEKGQMSPEQSRALADAFGIDVPVHYQGLSISPDERSAYVARVERADPSPAVPPRVYAPKAARFHAAARSAFSQGRTREEHPACCGCSDCPP